MGTLSTAELKELQKKTAEKKKAQEPEEVSISLSVEERDPDFACCFSQRGLDVDLSRRPLLWFGLHTPIQLKQAQSDFARGSLARAEEL